MTLSPGFPKCILTDIEGTTTPLSFVQKKLFPFSSEHLNSYLHQHHSDVLVSKNIELVKKTCQQEGRDCNSIDDVISALQHWIKIDRKHPALKEIQGFIWEMGYRQKKLISEIYEDVEPCLRKWFADGVGLGIYSSGSVHAQKLLFSHTPKGNLTPMFSSYFDTAVGAKRETSAYKNILDILQLSGNEVCFLSDVAEELDAAKHHDMNTIQLVRPGTTASERHRLAKDFYEVDQILAEKMHLSS